MAVAIGAGVVGCTIPGVEELSQDDPRRQTFGTTHLVTVNAPKIDDIHSGEARALALANQACGLAPTSPAEKVNLQLSQALARGRLYAVSCPASRKDIQ